MSTSTPPAPSATDAPGARRDPVPRRSTVRAAEKRWGLLLAAPATLHTLLWIGVPIVVAIVLSFTAYDIIHPPEFSGLENYATIFTDELFWLSVWHNVLIAGIGIPISMLLALVFATLLNRAIPGRGLFRVMVFLPHITATVAVAMIWLWIYAPTDNGLANMALSLFGIENAAWLTSTQTSLLSVLIVTIWQGVGLKMLIYLASLQGISKDLYEAADIDGAGMFSKFRHVTVPMLRPATFFVLVTSIIGNFQTFDLIYNLTAGGPANSTTVITYEIYQTAFQEFRMGLATAQSVILLLLLVGLTIVSRKIVGGTDND
jgi:multiple sugar transport system permease protein